MRSLLPVPALARVLRGCAGTPAMAAKPDGLIYHSWPHGKNVPDDCVGHPQWVGRAPRTE